MPHADKDVMGEPTVNGEKVYSHFLDHLTSYPIVLDSISTFKKNKYGAKSLEFADQGYTRIAKPIVPYLSTPYTYVAPYVAKADSLGDQGLTKIDTTFPIIREDTEKIKVTIYDSASYPLRVAGDVKAHVFDTYGSEYKKCGGDGMVATGKAVITTSLVLSQETLAMISSFLQTKKEHVKEIADLVADGSQSEAGPAGSPPQRRRMRRVEEEEEEEDDDSSGSADSDESADIRAPSSTDVMIKKLVRLALASEYSRQTIRRTDISAKVLGEQGSRQFKTVFEGAQKALRTRFGMELVELPVKEKLTLTQRRAAQKVEKPSTSNKSWIVTCMLPSVYRKPEILPPTKAPSSARESTYTALYTFIISLVMLNGGTLAEQKLERYLQRTNTSDYTPIDRTDRFLQRLCKEGYLVRNRETDNGEEIIEYVVGPRGKIEVGEQGVAGLVREVYGHQAPLGDDMTALEKETRERFERRLQRSLGVAPPEQSRGDGEAQGENAQQEARQRNQQPRRSRRHAEQESSDDDESD
ncbi:hypothetical protein ASPZODRAFT_63668 [Penicilliopsis zonata CBS 506.65]|uniref:MAGE domain-containing protein n=1 Tax=Penicilliopsis zonata CBS 506.65 TaxID=1073090 RepID=A0A1L9SKJ9_9EURO|nr:hypothetical protein ASPZODRAFT_63668 [Penicilliopsis zonata CBS 506.65]OJJ47584.1 hypothetical protein ASPZODRAFT_63668 [Penicilliopsis zonata CBS 506.65]